MPSLVYYSIGSQPKLGLLGEVTTCVAKCIQMRISNDEFTGTTS